MPCNSCYLLKIHPGLFGYLVIDRQPMCYFMLPTDFPSLCYPLSCDPHLLMSLRSSVCVPDTAFFTNPTLRERGPFCCWYLCLEGEVRSFICSFNTTPLLLLGIVQGAGVGWGGWTENLVLRNSNFGQGRENMPTSHSNRK